MHPPPRPSACALHSCEMHFRNTFPTPFSRTPTRVSVAKNASRLLFCDVRRRMHRSVRPRELPDARVRSVARHAGDCRCRPASTVENKQWGARGGAGGKRGGGAVQRWLARPQRPPTVPLPLVTATAKSVNHHSFRTSVRQTLPCEIDAQDGRF